MSIIRKGLQLGPNLPQIPPDPFVESILAHPVGAAPLIAALCRDIGIPQLIDAEATWDKARCILSPGERVTALIINLLCEERRPLYKVEDNFKKLDTELLFGEGILPSHFNDDCLGRGLDALWEIDPTAIFRRAAANVRTMESLGLPFLHFDTTTRILYGEYGFNKPPEPENLAPLKKATSALAEKTAPKAPDSSPTPPPEAAISGRQPANPAYGHSKDHRNDLLQITIAVACDRHGLPCLGAIKDGNASDKVSNLETIEEILAFFPPEIRSSMVYIADSALVTEKNLARLSQEKMHFVSLLPGTFSCGETVRKKAWDEGSWEDLGTISPRKDAASYRVSEQSAVIGGISYRLLVVHSSTLDKRKSRGILKAAGSEKASLEKAARELAKKIFFCERDARQAGEDFCQSHKSRLFPLSFTLGTRVAKEPKKGRGRPKKGEAIPETTVFFVNVTVGGIDTSVFEAETDRASCFVLITDLTKEKSSARQVLSEYKGQVVAENLFGAFVKNPVVLDAFFLKSKERLDALGHVLLLAALVYMLLQYRMRQAREPFDRPPRGLLSNPTSREALQHLSHAMVVRIEGGERQIQIPPDYKNGFLQVLRWAGFDPSIYVVPYPRSTGRDLHGRPPDPLAQGPPARTDPGSRTKEDLSIP